MSKNRGGFLKGRAKLLVNQKITFDRKENLLFDASVRYLRNFLFIYIQKKREIRIFMQKE